MDKAIKIPTALTELSDGELEILRKAHATDVFSIILKILNTQIEKVKAEDWNIQGYKDANDSMMHSYRKGIVLAHEYVQSLATKAEEELYSRKKIVN